MISALWVIARGASLRRHLQQLNQRWRHTTLAALPPGRAMLEHASALTSLRTVGRYGDVDVAWWLRPEGLSNRVTLALEVTTQNRDSPRLGFRHEHRASTQAPPRKPGELHDPLFDELFEYGGERIALLEALWPEARATLIRIVNSSFDVTSLELKDATFRARWSISSSEVAAPAVHDMLRAAIELAATLISPAPGSSTARLSAYANELYSPASRDALEHLFIHHKHTAHARVAARRLLARDDARMLLIPILRAPELVPSRRECSRALFSSMRRHPDASWRHEAMITAASNFADHPNFGRTLERVSLADPDDDLQAAALSLALRSSAPGLDHATMVLAAQRFLTNRHPSPARRQRLERALLSKNARPKQQSYQKLAADSSDKILRYSSLRALVNLFPDSLQTWLTVCERAHIETIDWIAEWCRRALAEAPADSPRRKHIETIAMSSKLDIDTRLEAALSLPKRMRALLALLFHNQNIDDARKRRILNNFTDKKMALTAERTMRDALRDAKKARAHALHCMLLDLHGDWPGALLEQRIPRTQQETRIWILERIDATHAPASIAAFRNERIAAQILSLEGSTTRQLAADFLVEHGSAHILPKILELLFIAERRTNGIKTSYDIERLQNIRRVHEAILSRVKHKGGTLSLAEESSDGALSLADPTGQLELIE